MRKRKCDEFFKNHFSLFTAHPVSPHRSPPNRYLLITTASGCEPTNKVFYVALEELPRDAEDRSINFTSFDLRTGSTSLPIVRLVDNFDASYDYVASEGSVFTWLTNLNAPKYRSGIFFLLLLRRNCVFSLLSAEHLYSICVACVVLITKNQTPHWSIIHRTFRFAANNKTLQKKQDLPHRHRQTESARDLGGCCARGGTSAAMGGLRKGEFRLILCFSIFFHRRNITSSHTSPRSFLFFPLQGDAALVTCYLRDVKSVLELRRLSTGELLREKILDPALGPGAVNGFSLKRNQSECFFNFTSFTTPGMTFRCVFLCLFLPRSRRERGGERRRQREREVFFFCR